MRKNAIALGLIVLSSLASCSLSDNESNGPEVAQQQLLDLVAYGFSIEELSVRTGYSVETLVDCCQNDILLEDSIPNTIISDIWQRNQMGTIIPINQTHVSASEALWQVYTKAQNFPIVSTYSGIGIVNVCHSMTKKTPLSTRDSVKALVAFVNMSYDISPIPQKLTIENNPSFNDGIENVSIPSDFHPELTDPQRRKIEYYLWKNEQFERRANYRLKQSIESKVNKNTNSAISEFIDDDVNSYLAVIRYSLNDSTEKQEILRQKLKEKLDLDACNQSIRDEIIAYCISVNTSRALLINDMLGYSGSVNNLSAAEKAFLVEYEARLDQTNQILYNKAINGDVEIASFLVGAQVTAFIMPWEAAFVATATVSGGPVAGGLATVLMFGLDDMIFENVNKVIDLIDLRSNEEKDTDALSRNLQNAMLEDINTAFLYQLNKEGNYYECLNKNTAEYYKNVRDYFKIK